MPAVATTHTGSWPSSWSTVSRICQDIDREVAPVRQRPLGHATFPYVFLDATYVKARVGHQVVSRAVVIATGVTAEGGREVHGVDVGDSEDAVFWTGFLTGLKDRELGGADLAISDAPRGLQASICKTMQGAGWQRCRVHLMRNILSHVPRGQAEMVAAFVRTTFAKALHAASSVRSRPGSNAHCPKPPACSLRPRMTSSPTPYSPAIIGARCGPRTRSSRPTRRSSGAPTSSACSPRNQAVLPPLGAILAK